MAEIQPAMTLHTEIFGIGRDGICLTSYSAHASVAGTELSRCLTEQGIHAWY